MTSSSAYTTEVGLSLAAGPPANDSAKKAPGEDTLSELAPASSMGFRQMKINHGVSLAPEGANLDEAIQYSVNHRKLNPRQIQLTSFAGAIGAALFVAIGSGVPSGPLCLLIAFIFWACVVFSIAHCLWLALGKVILAAGLILFTIVTMLGGNPQHDRFGFGHWRDPGVWVGADSSRRLVSFVNAVNVAGFCMGVPEYISMIAGEAADPRRTVPRAFSKIMNRLIIFFIGGVLCVGFLLTIRRSSMVRTRTMVHHPSKATDPCVIAMTRLQIPVLPSIVTAALITCVVSGGNAYTFNASRSLHALALEGQAPSFLLRLNRQNWVVISFTWIRFNMAMKAQGIDRESFLPKASKLQPYAGYFSFFWALQGYAVFLDGNWEVATFIFHYGIIALSLVGIMWKVAKRTRFLRSKEVDLHSGLLFFDALTEHYQNQRERALTTMKGRIVQKIF
ncbi:hypothetical protein PG994_005385 [Apiospora phragmitis]|uniref:Amino acid permease/ SLC12A domain-containing protein n=1 Tax=Apiospora phragmitis TaxID=2905665 RepID=A0ABR1VC36_9PEZI